MKQKSEKPTNSTESEKLSVVFLPVENLVPYARNAKRHDERQVAKIAGSIREFGFNNPVLVDKNNRIIAGHGRVLAAQKLGLAEVPCIRLGHLTDAQRRAYILADNRLAEIGGGWDLEMLKLELEELDIPLEDIGFGADDLAELDITLRDEGGGAEDVEPQIDRAAELAEKWGVKTGQLWRLGDHRILCGDSTKADDVERVLAGDKATLVFTDPPYGVSIGAKNRMLNAHGGKRGNTGRNRNVNDIVDDDASPEELKEILLAVFRLVRSHAMADDCSVMLTAPQGGGLGMMMMMMMMESGLPVRHVLTWVKNQPTFSMGRLDYDYQHEPILFTWLKRHKNPMRGDHKTSIWNIAKPRASSDHPTMKPPELYANSIQNHTDPGDALYEPFSGSGTAIIACEQTGRKCRAIEISPGYVAVALQRWADATGKEPELIG